MSSDKKPKTALYTHVFGCYYRATTELYFVDFCLVSNFDNNLIITGNEWALIWVLLTPKMPTSADTTHIQWIIGYCETGQKLFILRIKKVVEERAECCPGGAFAGGENEV